MKPTEILTAAALAVLLALLVTVAGVMALGTPAQAATRPPATYYGLHYAGVPAGEWPQAKVGAVRLHDTGTTWRDVNPAPGVYDWSRLDLAVATAWAHGAAIDLVLGGTPAWAASDPSSDAWMYPAGSNSPARNLNDWWVYVHAVATRYKGLISSYEPVNEPNGYIFWKGSIAQLALVARVARAAVRSADASAVMVAPSPTLRGDWPSWITAYARAGGYKWADAVGVHAYPDAGQGVAGAMRSYDETRALLRSLGVKTMPLWDTETNLETNTGRSDAMTAHGQALALWSYYRQAWKHGVSRVYWYDWSATSNIGVKAAAATGSTAPSEAGRAFTAVQSFR